MDRKRKKTGKKNLFIKELLGLAVIVAAALFIPQFIFYVKDIILYRDIELSKRENMDVEALSGNYEKSLYQRMLNFSAGLEAGDSFYVTSKDLTVSQELEEYLFSNSGLYQDIIEMLYSKDLIPPVFQSYQCTPTLWKQYVIYSDNYTKGVNFILWYIELQSFDDIILKILADAETGTFYALRLENCSWMDSDYSFYRFRDLFQEESMALLWYVSALYFESFSSEQELLKQIAGTAWGENNIDGSAKENIDIYSNEFDKTEYGILWADSMAGMEDSFMTENNVVISDEMIWKFLRDKIDYSYTDGKASFRLLYADNSLEVLLLFENWETNPSEPFYTYPNMSLGIRQIYEMIPEFL